MTLPGRSIVLDFETTGLGPRSGARVIEISAREYVDGRPGEEYLTFVDPGVSVPSVVTEITGITTSMLRGAPSSEVAMRRLVEFIDDDVVIGHNIGFDRGFLEEEARDLLGGRSVRTLCTLLLARRVYPGRSGYKLGAVAADLGIVCSDRLHRASADTFVTAALFGRICDTAQDFLGEARRIDHALLDRLQRIRIADACGWLKGGCVAA